MPVSKLNIKETKHNADHEILDITGFKMSLNVQGTNDHLSTTS